jgi:hypothetical protein
MDPDPEGPKTYGSGLQFKKKKLMKVVVAVAAILFIFPHFSPPGRSENQPEGVQRERAGAYYQALRYRARQER